MNPNRLVLTALLVAVTALTGCTDAPVGDTPATVSLVDFSQCVLEYPNGSPVPCDTSLDAPAGTTVSTDLVCVESVETAAFPHAWVAFWGNEGNHVEIEFRVRASEPIHLIGRAELEMDDVKRKQHYTAYQRDSGVLAFDFDGATGRTFTGLFSMYGISASGSPATLNTDHLDVRTSEYPPRTGIPWYVWAFQGEETYWFQSMAMFQMPGATSIVPIDTARSGEDFELEVNVTKYVQDLSIAVDLPDRLDLLLYESPCRPPSWEQQGGREILVY